MKWTHRISGGYGDVVMDMMYTPLYWVFHWFIHIFSSSLTISETKILIISRSIKWTVALHFNKLNSQYIKSSVISSNILILCKWLIHFESAFAFQKYANPSGKLYIKGIHYNTMSWYTIAVYMPCWWFQAVCFHTKDFPSLWYWQLMRNNWYRLQLACIVASHISCYHGYSGIILHIISPES